MSDSAIMCARDAEVPEVLEAHGPFVAEGRWPSVDLGVMTGVEVSSLAGIVLDLEGPASVALVAQRSNDKGPWIFRMPPGFTETLASLDVEELAGIASDWRATDELEGWALEDVRALVGTLASLARRAVATSSALYHWFEL